jgi:hypothetical protein
VGPEHGIGMSNSVKMLQGLALLSSIGGKTIRMPVFYQGPVGVLNLMELRIGGKPQGCIIGL